MPLAFFPILTWEVPACIPLMGMAPLRNGQFEVFTRRTSVCVLRVGRSLPTSSDQVY